MSDLSRREAIRRALFLLGGSLLLPDVLKAWDAPGKALPPALAGREALIGELAERILPATDTPGAKAAGVPAFIQTMLADCSPAADQALFEQGLGRLDAAAQQRFGRGFVDCPETDQHLLLEAEQDSPFFALAKRLTVYGYFTSEIGCTRALRYDPLPGHYDGDVAYAPGDGAWAN